RDAGAGAHGAGEVARAATVRARGVAADAVGAEPRAALRVGAAGRVERLERADVVAAVPRGAVDRVDARDADSARLARRVAGRTAAVGARLHAVQLAVGPGRRLADGRR